MPGPRLESILGDCERHALLHMALKWFDHWTTWAGLLGHLNTTKHSKNYANIMRRSCFYTKITRIIHFDDDEDYKPLLISRVGAVRLVFNCCVST